jgi:peptidoglycan/xylan/chitin deacetylase (PgdA/CDA1 family)
MRIGQSGLQAWAPAFAAALALVTVGTASPARAAACPGNPNALGTSRTLVVDPVAHPRIGTMQYEDTLPLRAGEVVLTFDDGPLPRHSNKVLDILAAECVKATFFLVGRMARQFPAGVRRVYDEGHTVGTHSENHPLNFNSMAHDQAQREIDDGIDAVRTALGNPTHLAPVFRIPGLRRAASVEDYLASKGIMTWSADFPADDWRHISSSQVAELALSRLAAKGKGILLLHDIQPRTVEALPVILRELKARGYRIVHVVPTDPQHPATPTEPWQWRLRPPATPVARTRWPAPPRFVFLTEGSLPMPDATYADTYGHDGTALHAAGQPGRAPTTSWPRTAPYSVANTLGFPIPALDLFAIQAPEADGLATGRIRHLAGPSGSRPPRQRTNTRPATAIAPPQSLLPGSAPINAAGLKTATGVH